MEDIDIRKEVLEWLYYENTFLFLSFLVDKLHKNKFKDMNKNTIYMRVYREIKEMEKEKLIKIENIGKYKALKLTKKGLLEFINLIKRGQNSNSKTQNSKRFIGGEERKKALDICKNKKMLDDKDREEIMWLFNDYLEKIEDIRIVLKEKEGEKILLKEYETRFNSKKRVVEQLNKFDKIVEYETKKTKWAVFLTLTTDPKKFKNIIEANKHFGKALNRFMTYIRKYLGDIRYICSYEYTKKGLIHGHIIIFGRKYLLNYKKISYLWDKQGQGKIVYIYALKNDGEGFKWAKGKPQEAKEKTGTDYLKKYLKKALFSEIWDLAMYWLFNKRFFSYSRAYFKILKKEQKIKNGEWEYLGTLKISEIPDYLLKNISELEEWIKEKFRIKKYWDYKKTWLGNWLYLEGGGFITLKKWSWLI